MLPLDARADYNRSWTLGSLAYFIVKGESMERAGFTMKASGVSGKLKLETQYSLAATFLGRVCISGQVDELRKEQYEVLRESIAYYKKLEVVIKNGASKIYGNRGKSTRYPTGTQVVVPKKDKEMLVVCHAFEQPGEKVVLDIPDSWDIKDSFHADKIRVEDGRLVVEKMNARTAQSVLLGDGKGEKNDVVE